MSWYDYLNPINDLNKLGSSVTSTGSTADDQAAIANSGRLQKDFLHGFNNFQNAYSPQQQALLQQQANQNIQGLQAAAAGKVPSPAELQLQQQSAKNSAAAFGTAAGLQGRNPGMALQQALRASAANNANTNAQAAQLRAQEQATAQNQLTQALQGQQGNQANLRGQDISGQQGLGQLALGASGQVVSAAGNETGANVQNAQMQNSTKGGIVNGLAGAGSALLSDPREKTDIHSANMDKLAAALRPFTFEYKHPGAEGETPGPRVGVMATDALRGGPAGRAMVGERGDGRLEMDKDNMLGAALAMGAEALRRSRKAA